MIALRIIVGFQLIAFQVYAGLEVMESISVQALGALFFIHLAGIRFIYDPDLF